MRLSLKPFLLPLCLSFSGVATGADEVSGRVSIFAAASLGSVIEEIVGSDSGIVVTLAGTATLARQISHGAPADIFISANTAWVDWLEGKGFGSPSLRRDIASNRLVLIGPSELAPFASGPLPDLVPFLEGGPFAIAAVDAVPAGIYGKAALSELGQWDMLSDFAAQTDSVSGALTLVATGAAKLGLVYRTDALAEPRVTPLATLPEDSHPPIRYTVAVLSPNSATTMAVYNELTSPIAQDIFARFGFIPVPSQ